jgi:PAS domain S-box-containing protein
VGGGLRRQRASEAAGFAAVAIAAAAFTGWWAALPLLASWGVGLPAVKPVAAACLWALGLALIYPDRNSRFAVAVGLAVTVLAALDLFGIDFGMNRWLVPRDAVPGTNAMAVTLGLVGASLALSRLEGHHFAATALGGLTGLGAVFALLNIYLTGLDPLAASIEPPALPTVIGQLCVAAGIVLRIGTMPALRKPRPLWHLHIVLGCAIIAPLLLFGAYAGLSIAGAQVRHVQGDLRSKAHTLSAEVDGEIIGEIDRRHDLVRSPDPRTLERLIVRSDLPAGWHAVVSDATDRIVAQSDREEAVIGKELAHAPWPQAGRDGIFEFVDTEGRPSLAAYARSELTGWGAAVWEPKALLEAPVRALWWTLGLLALLAITLVVALAIWLGRIISHSVGQAARAIVLGEGGPMRLDQTPVAEVNTLMAELRGAAARRNAAEDSLRESEATFRAMFDVSSVGKIEVEPGSGRFLRANAAMCNFVGYSEAELLARSVYDITYPDDLELDRELCRRLDVGESDFDVEKRYVRKDGKTVWARTTVNVIRDAFGRPLRHMAVIQDLDARKRAEEDVKASKDRLQLALNAAQLGSWQYDPLTRVVSGDARAQKIFDFAENAAVIEEVMKRVHPDDVEKVWAALEASLNPVDPKRSATEFRLRRAGGEIRWVETLGLAYFEGDGPERRAVSFGGTVTDITERRKREEERREREEKEHLLMREINHRAKNMLSVVDAIAHQTVASNAKDFVERFSERIQALSANQDLLVRNEWNGVEIADLVRAQLAHFADLIGSRIAMHGPKLRLNPASAQAIGLALHELATNAGKYGALSADTGRVDVCWGTDGDALIMSWTEREGPLVSAPRRRGFGTIVMETMAERSVDGKVAINYALSGLTWRLTCPAANALEPREREQNSGEGKNELVSSEPPRFVQSTQVAPAPTKIFAKT